jgi:hypothetical protein
MNREFWKIFTHYWQEYSCPFIIFSAKYCTVYFLCPAALHSVANISMHIFSISLIFLVSGILFF